MVSSELDYVINIIINDPLKRTYLVETVGLRTIDDLIELVYKTKFKSICTEKDLLNHNDHITGCPLSDHDRFSLKIFINSFNK